MIEILIILTVTAGAFIGTNLDNLALLVTLHTHYRDHRWAVSAGYITGMLVVGIICLLIGELDELIPVAYLGLLGVIPVASGVVALFRLLRKGAPDRVRDNTAADNTARSIFSVLLITQLSNSTDTIIAFSALLAESTDFADHQIAPAYLVMVVFFAWLARYFLKHQRLSSILERYGGYVTPFILILVGVYIINNTVTDLLPGS